MRVATDAEQRYPDDSATQDLVACGVWAPIGAEYARHIEAVTR